MDDAHGGQLVSDWASRLRGAAMDRLRGTPWDGSGLADAALVEAFRDDAGHHRRVDGAFLRWRLGVRGHRRGDEPVDVSLWWDVLEGTGGVPGGEGALFPNEHGRAIEVWTEMELCGLHALAWRARQVDGARWHEGRAWGRCVRAMGWLMDNVQPDNATQHPWALHLFAWSSAQGGFGEPWRGGARVYAEMMLHAALLPEGRPELFSACVLLDGSEWLAG